MPLTARLTIASALIFLVSACAHPTSDVPKINPAAAAMEKLEEQKLFLRKFFDDSTRLQRVANRVARAAVDFCGTKRRGVIGIGIAPSLPGGAMPAMVGLYPSYVPEVAFVTFVDPDMSAAKAGVKVGDIITAVDSVGVTAKTFRSVMGRHTSGNPVALYITRGGREITLTASPITVCGYPFGLEQGPILNAFADGKSVHVFTGMMNFVRSDEELAVVLGHELAHNFRGHLEAQKENALGGVILGAILDGLAGAAGVNTGGTFSKAGGNIGATTFSVDFEREADYVGLYVMARAGYTIDDAPTFWRRMAVENPDSITMVTTHPATPERFLALAATIKEIKAKQAAHQPLVPNEKSAPTS